MGKCAIRSHRKIIYIVAHMISIPMVFWKILMKIFPILFIVRFNLIACIRCTIDRKIECSFQMIIKDNSNGSRDNHLFHRNCHIDCFTHYKRNPIYKEVSKVLESWIKRCGCRFRDKKCNRLKWSNFEGDKIKNKMQKICREIKETFDLYICGRIVWSNCSGAPYKIKSRLSQSFASYCISHRSTGP